MVDYLCLNCDEAWSHQDRDIPTHCIACGSKDIIDELEAEFDGQPDEYTEWQDVYGGDDWDHGQYDEY